MQSFKVRSRWRLCPLYPYWLGLHNLLIALAGEWGEGRFPNCSFRLQLESDGLIAQLTRISSGAPSNCKGVGAWHLQGRREETDIDEHQIHLVKWPQKLLSNKWNKWKKKGEKMEEKRTTVPTSLHLERIVFSLYLRIFLVFADDLLNVKPSARL